MGPSASTAVAATSVLFTDGLGFRAVGLWKDTG
jgi:hypothetical protein